MPEKKQKLSYVPEKRKRYCQVILIIFLCTYKSTSQARIKPKILPTLGPNPARLTTLSRVKQDFEQ